VLAQLVQDLVHLEGGDDGFDQRGGLDAALWNFQFFLSGDEDLIPQAGLEVRLHLRQVEVRARAAREQLLRVMEEVQREVENSAGDRLAVDGDVLLVQVPAARARDEHSGLVLKAVQLLAGVRPALEADRAAHRIAQVDLPVDHVVPRRAVGVLEVRHERGSAAVERVDHHLAVGGAGDLDAPVEHVLRLRRHDPVAFANRFCLRQKIRQLALIKLLLARGARGEELLAPGLELAVKLGDEAQRFRAEDFGKCRGDRGRNGDALGKRGRHVHRSILLRECGTAT
jgi:hypothetical protein